MSGESAFPDQGGAAYLDSSPLAKLVLGERESGPLRTWLTGWPRRASSTLSRLEVIRAVRRAAPHEEARARAVLDTIDLILVTDDHLQRAERVGDPQLGSLDALCLATAIEISAEVLVAYDRRLLASARAAGLRVESPGAGA